MASVVLGDSSSSFTSTKIPVADWENLEPFDIPARSLIRFQNNKNLENIDNVAPSDAARCVKRWLQEAATVTHLSLILPTLCAGGTLIRLL